jgi:hypothetical protein
MPARKPPPPDEEPQFERFLETVREVEAAETDEGLDEAVHKVLPKKKVMPGSQAEGQKASRQRAKRSSARR